jgi:hypothetical protein
MLVVECEVTELRSGASNRRVSRWGRLGWERLEAPRARRVRHFDASLLVKSIQRRAAEARPSTTHPTLGVGRPPPPSLGKCAKWSDWFPEPSLEPTRAGRRWRGGLNPEGSRGQATLPPVLNFPDSGRRG